MRKGRDDALSYLQADKTPDPLTDTSTLRDRVCHQHYDYLSAIRDELREAEADAALEERAKKDAPA